MYGFKPRHAQGKPVQNLADGGIVHSLTGMLGMRKRTPEELRAADAKSQARNQEAATAAAGRAQAAPDTAAPAAPAKAISDYSGMLAMQRREKEQGLADGGAVKPRGFVVGKGTGTSDSIPARLSNGEYVLPADTVKAVGVEALDSLRAATHTPVKHEQAKAAHGFFAGGTPGGVDEEKRKNSFGDAAAVARDPSVTQVGGLANNGGADAARFAQVPAPIGTQPNRTPEPAAPGAPQPAAQTAPAKVPLGQMHSIGARSGAQMVADGARSGAQSFFDSFQKAPDAPAVAPSAVAPAGMPGYKTDVQRGGGNVPAIDTAAPTATAPSAPAAATTPREVVPGVFKHGRGQYSDQSTGMGMPAGFTGQPSAANNAILQRMSDQSQAESMARVSAQQPAGFAPSGMTAPTVRHSGNDWQSRNELRNALVSASSITNNGGKWDYHGKGNVSPERAAYLAMLGTDQALRQSQPGADVAAMRENAGIQREGMQQDGATARTGMQEQGASARDAGRTAIARGELGLKQTAAGFQVRAAQQLEGLQNQYAAETDPAKQAALARQIREVQGKEQPARYKVAAGGQQIDANGVAYKVPDRVFNEQTGQFSDGTGAAPTPAAAPKAGETRNGYRFKGGNPNDQANWAKV